jgi:hypothetical protein
MSQTASAVGPVCCMGADGGTAVLQLYEKAASKRGTQEKQGLIGAKGGESQAKKDRGDSSEHPKEGRRAPVRQLSPNILTRCPEHKARWAPTTFLAFHHPANTTPKNYISS